MRRAVRVIMLALAATASAALTAGGGVPSATAHEGEGIITVESTDVAGTEATFRVRLTWQNDGHAALDATITATPLREGAAQTPVPMEAIDADGRYGATLTLEPGAWTVRFTSVTPQGTLEVPLEIAQPTTTAAPSTTSSPSTTGSPSTTADGVVIEDEDEGGLGAPAVAGIAAAVVAGGVGVWAAVKRPWAS
jgi:hypothetical protein